MSPDVAAAADNAPDAPAEDIDVPTDDEDYDSTPSASFGWKGADPD